MEQSVGARKKQIIILSLGGALALALITAHFFSSVSRSLSTDRDIEIALLSPERPMLFVYHPGAKTVDAVPLPPKAARGTGSAVQRAHGALNLFLKNPSDARDEVLYVEVKDPDLDRLSVMLDNWRNRCGYVFNIAAYIRELKRTECTNLSWHDLLLVSRELSRLNWSDFIITDQARDYFDKAAAMEETTTPGGTSSIPAPVPAGIRLEVLNASARAGLAEQITKYLRKKRFDVISFGNYRSVTKQTKIVNCSDNIEAAQLVRDALGLNNLEIHSKAEKSAVIQVRVILGVDFDETKIESPALFNKESGR